MQSEEFKKLTERYERTLVYSELSNSIHLVGGKYIVRTRCVGVWIDNGTYDTLGEAKDNIWNEHG